MSDSDSKTTHKKATNLLKKTHVEGVWMIGVYKDGSEMEILIPRNREVPIKRGNDVKVLYITNGTDKIPMMKGPVKCKHADCSDRDCTEFIYRLTARLIQLVRAAK
jgi:hypothetical protein